jgi:hypothetical protein
VPALPIGLVLTVDNPLNPRRYLLGAVKRMFDPEEMAPDTNDVPPRLTVRALEATRMPRSRDRILSNLEDMYREAFERAKASGDQGQQATLDFAYRREQLYFEILLDIRDGMNDRR